MPGLTDAEPVRVHPRTAKGFFLIDFLGFRGAVN